MDCEHQQPELQHPGVDSLLHIKLHLELCHEHCCDFAASREEGCQRAAFFHQDLAGPRRFNQWPHVWMVLQFGGKEMELECHKSVLLGKGKAAKLSIDDWKASFHKEL